MQKRENFIPFFLVFFGLSLALILSGRSGVLNGLSSIINRSMLPAKSATLGIFSFGGFQNKTIKDLSEENAQLKKRLINQQNLIAENKALRDQFAKSGPESQSLLPANVVGAPGFIPGLSLPDYLVLDKGFKDNVMIGAPIVIENYLVGKVVQSSSDFSRVELVISKNSSFTAAILPTDGAQISGIIKGKGSDEMIFDNVLLAFTIKKGDMVLTRGEKNEQGVGYPPNLIVGKVVSVEKKSSDLFQKAQVKSLVDFTNLTTVFVLR